MNKLFAILFLSTLAFGELININPEQLQKHIEKNTVIIDIRTPPEWKDLGVVPTSKKIMFFNEQGGYNIQHWMTQFSQNVQSKDQPFVLVCRSGNRTGSVGNFLATKMGYKNVYHLQHGIKSWIKEKREVIK